MPDALAATDHPSGDGPNTYVVSQATKKAGLTVALSGLGGDELFAGYPVFRRTVDLIGKQWAMAWPKGSPARSGRRIQTGQAWVSAATNSPACSLATAWTPLRPIPSAGASCSKKTCNGLSQWPHVPDSVAQWCRTHLDHSPGLDLPVLSRIGLAEMHTYMQHVLLRDTDQMSMAHALEVRVPFLDHRLVETALAISDPIKFPHTPKIPADRGLGRPPARAPSSTGPKWASPSLGKSGCAAPWKHCASGPSTADQTRHLGQVA